MQDFEKVIGVSVNDMIYAITLCTQHPHFSIGVYVESEGEIRVWWEIAIELLQNILKVRDLVSRPLNSKIYFNNGSRIRFDTSNSTSRGGRFCTVMISDNITQRTRERNILWHLVPYDSLLPLEFSTAETSEYLREIPERLNYSCLW